MTQSTSDIEIYDRALLRRRRDRTAALDGDQDFLFREVADRLADRLLDIARPFDHALDLGARDGGLAAALLAAEKVRHAIAMDIAPRFAAKAAARSLPAVVAEEDRLPFQPGSFDLIVSNLALHWVNDLPGALVQINRALKPDGLFQAAVFGGETLQELRHCLMAAEEEVTGGVSPRISPMLDLRDAAGLLQRAGFTLPVADLDRIEVTYDNAFRLMAELRAMGEGNLLLDRLRKPTRRAVFLRAAELYAQRHAGPDGRIPATFEIVYLHGWHPAESQPKPLRPGSASTRLAEVLDSEEVPLKD